MNTSKAKSIVFASGSADGGGSGFKQLVLEMRAGLLETEIVAVVSNHERGGVWEKAQELGIPFTYFPGPWTAEEYQRIVAESGAEYVLLSGWLKKVRGLNPRKTINIHPGDVDKFGGKGMYGHHVHEAAIAAYKRGEITHTIICMHFVTEDYDRGPVFFRLNIPIHEDDTPETLAKRVNEYEHLWQPVITNRVVTGQITWSGNQDESPEYPSGYRQVHFAD